MKTIFRKIGGRIIPISSKQVKNGLERINAIKKVREFVKKRNDAKKLSSNILLNSEFKTGGVDVRYGSRIDDKFVKEFDLKKNIETIESRSGKDFYLEKKGLGPKTFYIKTKKSIYGVQDNIHNILDTIKRKKSLKERVHAERRFNKSMIKNIDKMIIEAKRDNVHLRDLNPKNIGYKGGKMQLFDSGLVDIRGNQNFDGYKKLLKLIEKSKKNRIGF
jgi:hypothetical protein